MCDIDIMIDYEDIGDIMVSGVWKNYLFIEAGGYCMFFSTCDK